MTYRVEVGYGEEEAAVYELHKTMGMLSVIEDIKPIMTSKQLSLLGAFYRLSQERGLNNDFPLPIKDKDIHYYQSVNGSCHYAGDLFIMLIHAIDAEYMTNKCNELVRKK